MTVASPPDMPARTGVLAEARQGNREPLARLAILLLGLFLVLVCALALATGPLDLDLFRVVGELFGDRREDAVGALGEEIRSGAILKRFRCGMFSDAASICVHIFQTYPARGSA